MTCDLTFIQALGQIKYLPHTCSTIFASSSSSWALSGWSSSSVILYDVCMGESDWHACKSEIHLHTYLCSLWSASVCFLFSACHISSSFCMLSMSSCIRGRRGGKGRGGEGKEIILANNKSDRTYLNIIHDLPQRIGTLTQGLNTRLQLLNLHQPRVRISHPIPRVHSPLWRLFLSPFFSVPRR